MKRRTAGALACALVAAVIGASCGSDAPAPKPPAPAAGVAAVGDFVVASLRGNDGIAKKNDIAAVCVVVSADGGWLRVMIEMRTDGPDDMPPFRHIMRDELDLAGVAELDRSSPAAARDGVVASVTARKADVREAVRAMPDARLEVRVFATDEPETERDPAGTAGYMEMGGPGIILKNGGRSSEDESLRWSAPLAGD